METTAELLQQRTPGSKTTDALFRGARQRGFSPDHSVKHVYLVGLATGAGRAAGHAEADVQAVMDIYAAHKATGLTHGEALDNVFLSGYEAGKIVTGLR